MSKFEQLPAEQQAVISLLVRQGRSYSEVAALVATDPALVRGRAQRAILALGPEPPAGLSATVRLQIVDYIVGQASEAERIETLALLMDSEAARIWARALAAPIQPLANVPLPAIPADPDPTPQPPPAPAAGTEPNRPREARQPPEPRQPRAPREPRQPRQPKPPREPRQRREPRPRKPRSEQRAGFDRGLAVLLVAAVLLVVAIVAFVSGSGGSSAAPGPIPASAATTTTAGNTGTTTSTSGTDVVAHLTLNPTAFGGSATGEVAIVKISSKLDLAFSASHLPSPGSDHYVLWLYSSPTHFKALGLVPSVTNGTVSPLAVALPAGASSYNTVELTLETTDAPTSPGEVVLSGTSSSSL